MPDPVWNKSPLNHLIARHVFGVTIINPDYFACPAYDREMGAAWLIVERFRDMHTEMIGQFARPKLFNDSAFFDTLFHVTARHNWPWAMLYATPEAICRAALAALGVEIPDS